MDGYNRHCSTDLGTQSLYRRVRGNHLVQRKVGGKRPPANPEGYGIRLRKRATIRPGDAWNRDSAPRPNRRGNGHSPGAVRRIMLLACGVGVARQNAAPSHRPRGDGQPRLQPRAVSLVHRYLADGRAPFAMRLDTSRLFDTWRSAMQVCAHVDEVRPIRPRTRGCEECLKDGDSWVHLRLCLTCGHVGC